MAVMRFENVGKTYDDGTVAIANVDLEIAHGEFLVLVGPSGCGKSTLLRSAAGLEDLTTGRFWLDDTDMTFTDPADRDVAMIFQNYALYPHMTVHDNLAFGLEQRGVSRPEIERKIQETARIIGLEDQLRRKPGALSGGQRQRVAMGRAIIRDPAAYLMDEPLSNLDAKLRVQMRAELKLLTGRLGVTTLYVTHDQDEAMTMGDRVAVLRPIGDAGETNLQQTAAPREVYAHPSNLFVAGFIGSPAMNFLNARVTTTGRGLAFAVAGLDTRFDISAQSLVQRPGLAAYDNRAVIVGIRPEDLCLVGARKGPVLNVGLLVTETTGPDAYLYCDLKSPPVSHTDVAVGTASYQATRHGLQTRLIARVPASEAPTGETVIRLAIASGNEYFFDPMTGIAIS